MTELAPNEKRIVAAVAAGARTSEEIRAALLLNTKPYTLLKKLVKAGVLTSRLGKKYVETSIGGAWVRENYFYLVEESEAAC